MIQLVEEASPIATRPPASVTARRVQVRWTPGVIIAGFLRRGKARAREILTDQAGDRLRRDPGRRRGTDPTPLQPCRVFRLRGPEGERGRGIDPPGTLASKAHKLGKPDWELEPDQAEALP